MSNNRRLEGNKYAECDSGPAGLFSSHSIPPIAHGPSGSPTNLKKRAIPHSFSIGIFRLAAISFLKCITLHPWLATQSRSCLRIISTQFSLNPSGVPPWFRSDRRKANAHPSQGSALNLEKFSLPSSMRTSWILAKKPPAKSCCHSLKAGVPNPKHVAFPGGTTNQASKKEFPGARQPGSNT